MKLMRIAVFFIMLIMLFSGCNTSGSSDVVINIGNEEITAGEIKFLMAQNIELINQQFDSEEEAEEFWSLEDNGKKMLNSIKESSVEHLVNYAVLSQAAKGKRITASEDEIDLRMDAVYSLDALKNFRDKYGVPQGSVKDVVRKQILQEKYMEEIIEKEEGYMPTEEALAKLFKDNYYKAQHILIKHNGSEPLEETRKRAEKILDDAHDGEDFLGLMLENSHDISSREFPEGYVFTYGEMSDEFYNTVISLSENQISGLVETSYGFHIIKRVPVLDSDFAAAEAELVSKYKNDYINSYTQQLKAEYKVERNDAELAAVTVDMEN